MNIEERLKELSKKITNRFYSNLEITDESQFDGLDQFVFDSIFSTYKEALKKQRADKLVKGCVVMMESSSGMKGYGDSQCVKSVCEPLSEISLYGHNQHYKIWDVKNILEYPILNAPEPEDL